MTRFIGEVKEDSTVDFFFTTNDGSGGAVAPSSAFEAADLAIYKDNSATQKATTNGVTMTSPFDSVTGLHHVRLDTSNDTGDAGFWAAGSDYTVVLNPDETVDTQTVVAVLAQFSVENRLVTNVYSDTTIIHSDTIVISSDTAAIHSDTTIIASDLVIVGSDTAAIHSDTTIIASDVVQVYSDTTAIHSETTAIQNQATNIYSDTTIIASDLVIVGSDTAAIHSDTTIIHSDTIVISSDTAAIHSDTTIIASDVVLIYSDTAAIHSDTTIIASDVVLVYSDTASIDAHWTTALTEAYAADGATFTPAQAMYMIWSALSEFSISSTTITSKKLDGSTTAMTHTLDDASTPTSRTRAT